MGTAECLKKLERGKDKTKWKSLVNVLCGTWEKRENDDDINGRLGSAQSSPRKPVTKFPVLIILDLNLSQDKWQRFCDNPTIKACLTQHSATKARGKSRGINPHVPNVSTSKIWNHSLASLSL
jgi:hypothetical protein